MFAAMAAPLLWLADAETAPSPDHYGRCCIVAIVVGGDTNEAAWGRARMERAPIRKTRSAVPGGLRKG